uniref:Uncharacterized protein n=1 Tax=Meloidogyne enterolobii TaxID=390850 RepID=A0A6V7X7M9_MELEN|nr:unnamed protein product [Meloidogyne enterolobii]
MHWLVLAAIALLLLDGEAKENETLEEIPRLPQDIYLPPNDPKDCTGEFYKPEYQLPLPQPYKSVYDPVKLMINGKEEISSFFVKDTIKVKDFKKVYAKQEEWLKDLMFRELILQKLILKKLKENKMFEGENEENIEMKEIEGKILEVKENEIEELMEEIGMDKIEELMKERKKMEEDKKEVKKIEKEKKEEKKEVPK